MSKLHDLLTKLCPNGVPYKKLGEIEKDGIIKLGRGKVISKKDIANNPGSYPIYSASAINNGKFGEYGDYMFDDIRLTWSIDGGGRFFYRDDEKYSVTNVCGWLKVLDENAFNPKFLFYVLTSEWSKLVFNYTIKAHPSVIRNTYDIPMVPLPVQSEVVRILDAFTELEAELEAELAGRKEQYEYYRDRLLDEKNLEAMDGKPVETKRLDEVFNLKNGYTPSKNNAEYWKNGDVNWFRMDDIRTNGRILSDSIQKVSMDGIKGGKLFEADSLIVSTSATIGEHALITVPFMCNQRFACLTRKPDYKPLLDMKFMFYYASKLDKYCLKNINQGGFASVSMPAFKEFSIPLPSLATQERIVDILDRFDTLTTSLTKGIPAEIAMRCEQYEYYRSKLLDFPRLSDDSDSDGNGE